MVKQYVGARYVPKFASPVEWAADTSYEALTIVTFNNASYTSKVPVPPTIGNPANNPQYWALTGNYNAQVEQYRQETATVRNNLNAEITNRENADTALQGQMEQYRQESENVKINYSKCFNTAANMIADTSLTEGMIVKTLGYKKIADNGGAFYKIYNTKEQNSEHYENLSNGKYALLIPNGYITPEMFGAYGDGTTDDSQYFINCLTVLKTGNTKTLILNNTYKLATTFEFDFGWGHYSIYGNGILTITAPITFKNINDSYFRLILANGGNNNVDEFLLTFKSFQFSILDLHAYDNTSTAFRINTKSSWSTLKVIGHNNKRLLYHGNSETLSYAFGTYSDIFDCEPEYPIHFEYSNDITILHYENFINDSTQTKYSLEFNKCRMINMVSCAIGGVCNTLLHIKSSHININYLFMVGEVYSGDLVNGLTAEGGDTILQIDKCVMNYLNKGIHVKLNNTRSDYFQLGVVQLEGTTTPITVENWLPECVNSLMLPITGFTPTLSDNFVSDELNTYVINHSLVIQGQFHTTAEIPSYTQIFKNLREPCYTTNMLAFSSDGILYPLFINGGSNYIQNRKTIPNNTTLTVNISYPLINTQRS